MPATVVYLEGKSVDDCLDLLDLLMTTELIGKAESATDKERARRHPKPARHSATPAAAMETLLEVTEADRHARSARTAVRKIPPPRRGIRPAIAGRGSTASFLSGGLRFQAPAGPL
ncbi:hypothetical protein AB0M95_37305 [Sphaerisporangium sp. NPDC051017]|uniref:hypothetical protein n=1 Tax=Sphaerisporangium sp. NPDC051017 TaxID=3154636 RepID=UPI0034329C96